MIPVFKPNPLRNLKIRSKLLAVNLLVIVVFAAVALTVILSFRHVRHLLTETVSGHVEMAAANAQTGVALSMAMTEASNFLHSYYTDKSEFEDKASSLRIQAAALIERNMTEELKAPLIRFRDQVEALTQQCRLVNAQLLLITVAEGDLSFHIDNLEEIIAEEMIDRVLAGQETDTLEQFSALAMGYRETLLRASRIHANNWPDHYALRSNPSDPLAELLNDFLLRVRTLSAGTEAMASEGRAMSANIENYLTAHARLHVLTADLARQAARLRQTMNETMAAMAERDARFMTRASHVEDQIATATNRTGLVVVLMASIMVIALAGATMVFIQDSLRGPMAQISKGLKALSSGDFNTTLNMGRQDEWAEIERDINAMAMSLASYYAEIQENRAEIEQAYNELLRAEQKYRTVADFTYDLEAWLGPGGEMLYISPSCERITGYRRERFMDDPGLLHTIIHRDDVNLWRTHMVEASTRGEEGTDFRIFRRDGRMRWISQVTTLLPDDQGLRFSMRDITDRKFMERQLEYESLHDPLTGLSNRVLCLDRINLALERSKRHGDSYFAVVFMDLDRFKVINDSLGHSFGDKLLIETSTRLLKCVREVDTVSRFGGDEFILLLEDLDLPREGIRTVKRVRDVFREPFRIDGHNIPMSASFGVVLSPTGTNNPEEILQNANIAMHRAKESGRDRIKVFNTRMLDQAQGQMTLENDLRQGLADEQFHLMFQPIFSLKKHGLTGFECLSRWLHPERGNVSPGEFIPVAESSGLIVDLGIWVLGRACSTYVRWLERYPDQVKDLTMSVNVSSRQFSRHDLVEQVAEVLEKTGMPPRALKLEITETSIMEYAGNVVGKLYRLKDLGILVSIDDFGTGYSSMAYLQRFPLDNLKIDLSFVKMLDVSQENVEIVRAIITLAHTLGLEVVAEGVEKKEHLEQLCALDCEYGQGYYFSHPLSEEQAEELLLHPERIKSACPPDGTDPNESETKQDA